jgi:hypothetical protein
MPKELSISWRLGEAEAKIKGNPDWAANLLLSHYGDE